METSVSADRILEARGYPEHRVADALELVKLVLLHAGDDLHAATTAAQVVKTERAMQYARFFALLYDGLERAHAYAKDKGL